MEQLSPTIEVVERMHRKERRREPRDGASRSVYLQAFDTQGRRFEEVRTMLNYSRTGFYFITHRVCYRPGMQVYAIPAFGCVNFEYDAEVARVEHLPFGEFGVGVRLRRMGNLIVGGRNATRTGFQPFALADRVEQP